MKRDILCVIIHNSRQINEYNEKHSSICYDCWTKVEQFNQFYKLVQIKHGGGRLTSAEVALGDEATTADPVDISYKMEEIFVENIKSETFATDDCDMMDYDDGAHSDDETTPILTRSKKHKPQETDSEDESIPLSIRLKPKNQPMQKQQKLEPMEKDSGDETTSIKQVHEPKQEPQQLLEQPSQPTKDNLSKAQQLEQLVIKYMSSKCDKCEEEVFLNSLPQAFVHFATVHKAQRTHLQCCNQKFSTNYKLRMHCLWHKNPDAFK